PINSVLRRGMFAAAVLLLLAVVCAAPAAASADDAVVFDGSGHEYSTATALAEALGDGNATLSSDSTLKLLKDINVTGTINITGSMTILGEGHTIWRGASNTTLINITRGTLTLGDGLSPLTIHGQDDKFNQANNNGWSLIHVTGGTTELIMNDGITITNASVRKGNNLDSGFKPCNAAGIMVYMGATFTMNGGLITNNTATYGAGVYLYDNAKMIMNGGAISGNKATEKGSGVAFHKSRFTMNDGEISGNPAGSNGAMVYGSGSTFYMYGGKISENGGSGVYMSGIERTPTTYSIFRMYDGEISGNKADNNGGGIFAHAYSRIWVLGGKISNNTANKNGGGIYFTGGSGASCSVTGGEISGNKANNNGGGMYIFAVDEVHINGNTTFTENTASSGQAIYIDTANDRTQVRLSGNVIFSEDQTFTISKLQSATGIRIPAPYTGEIKFLELLEDNLDGKTIFTVDPAAGTATSILPRLGLADTTKWTLTADDSTGKIIGTLNKPIALSGADNVTVKWINSTIANVSIRLDPNANDATDVSVKLGSQTSQTLSDTFPKGSTISDLQVTGLTPGQTYAVTAVLKNTGISTKTFTSEILTGVQAPTPAKVVITGEGGTELPESGVLLPQDNSMTFGVLVYDTASNLLKDEPVTWSGAGTYTTEDASTPTTITLTGTSAGTDTLTATTVHGGSVTGTALIEVTTTTPTSLSITADKQTIALGDTIHLTAVATDDADKQFAGYDVTWTVSPSETISASKTGAAVSFTPTTAGTYTISATVADPSLTADSVTITVVGKPTITDNPTDAAYTSGETDITDISVSATAPGSGTLGYQWQKSTDPAFGADVTDISGATQTTYTPDVSTAGTWYYRANVTYTEDGFTTWEYSAAAKITVLVPTADEIRLNPDQTEVTITKGANIQITATAYNNTIQSEFPDPKIVWTIDSAKYAQISQNGDTVTLTGLAAGTSTLSVHTGSVEKQITVTVTDTTPGPDPSPGPGPQPQPPVSSSGSGNMDGAYRVLFETSGGSFISPATGLSSGDRITAPANPVKDGYTFAGWYKDSACTQSWSFSDGIPGDMTLYAKWTGGSSSSQSSSQQSG
ncbi:InlB B-repeat-containing protein, partial [Methanocorpusculum sp. MG]